MDEKENQKDETAKVTFQEFLESVPPGKIVIINPFNYYTNRYNEYLRLPEITLHCDGEFCNGERFFKSTESEIYLENDKYKFHFVRYICKNCQQTSKVFAIAVALFKGEKVGRAFKFGEFPSFGPPTPAKLIELIGPDREIFLMGRRCENQGLGIGAFVYYRRVVENQKNRIFDKIIQVAQKISADEGLIKELEEAKKETQFSKAVESIKHTLPESLRIDNHNPLTLLHKALSEGVHDKTDEECLDTAQSIRIVLGELSSRLAQALQDEAGLKSAISKIMKKK
jgi:hypothetical protein